MIEALQMHGSLIIDRFIDLIFAPYFNAQILWIAIPLLIATVLMALYFGKHPHEDLGWNTAFGNSMVFLFVAIDIIRTLHNSTVPGSWYNLISPPLYAGVSIALFALGSLLLLVNYYHVLPRKLDFLLCSGPPVNVACYTLASLVYAKVTPDRYTFFAALFMLFVLVALLRLVQYFVRPAAKKSTTSQADEKEEEEESDDEQEEDVEEDEDDSEDEEDEDEKEEDSPPKKKYKK
jgi:TRAP-type C4-dicarboxylate transport system permease small subunit